MADTAINRKPVQQRSALERGVDKVWRFFTSVRNAIYEIAFLTRGAEVGGGGGFWSRLQLHISIGQAF